MTITNADVSNLTYLYHAEPCLWNSADLDKLYEKVKNTISSICHSLELSVELINVL